MADDSDSDSLGSSPLAASLGPEELLSSLALVMLLYESALFELSINDSTHSNLTSHHLLKFDEESLAVGALLGTSSRRYVGI